MKSLRICVLGLLLVLLTAGAGLAAGSKVGFVNPQRIINESELGRLAQDDLAVIGKEKDRLVREALAEVDEIKAKLDVETPLSVSEEQLMEASLRSAVRSYEDLVKRSNLDIQSEERRLIEFVMHRADAILKSIAEQRGFTMILTDPEIIGYVNPAMDITDQVIQQLNASM